MTSRARTADLDAAFAPPGEPWVGVSRRLRGLRRTIMLAIAVPVTVVVAVGLGVPFGWPPAVAAVVVGVVAIAVSDVAIARNQRSWGYAERAEDLLVKRGVMFRQLVVVPYGRMQLVDVEAGPLERRFGLATVRLHTASAGTDARIPGLVPQEAARLRDRLASLGEASSAGL